MKKPALKKRVFLNDDEQNQQIKCLISNYWSNYLENFGQFNLFSDAERISNVEDAKNWGTFKDSLRSPVHKWFTYPAGFSYKAVTHSIERHNIKPGMVIYDPFMGSGTTNVTAKSLGIDSIGVEAHPFVYKIAKAKLEWNVNKLEALLFIDKVNQCFKSTNSQITSSVGFQIDKCFPELILKCYPEETLIELHTLKSLYQNEDLAQPTKEFFYVVITALLRKISSAATGWPYIAPKKVKTTSAEKNVLIEFSKLSYAMLEDLEKIKISSVVGYENSKHLILNSDSRNTVGVIQNESIDHVFTSPPYLNNFDYSDRTRLELYFWGEANNWGEISHNIRTKLITSATTQILRGDTEKYTLTDDFRKDCPKLASFIQTSSNTLGELRKVKGGKKSYDLMVIGYFNDMHKIVRDVFRVLKSNSQALFVLGDSAPYGVHIPTDKLIGEIGLGVGFNNYQMEILRKRGDKWKNNPQRHGVSLQESIIILEKK